ncbi:MAG: phenylacetate--CoA ligase family protein [Candidatus Brocadiia bacterium]
MKSAHLFAARALMGLPPPSPEKIRQIQERALRQLVQHAYHRVPFYRQLFDNHGVSPKNIRSLEDLHRLPVISRKDLQQTDMPSRIAEGVDIEKLFIERTSGSSGEPLTVLNTYLERRLFFGYYTRVRRHFGLRATDSLVSITIPPCVPDVCLPKRLAHWLNLYRNKSINALQPTRDILRIMRKHQIDILAGMPTALHELAIHATREDQQAIRPKCIQSGGDTLTPSVQKRLREVFRAPVRQAYGSHEFKLIAWECTETGEMHTCDDALIVEILKDGRPAKPGETGELVATNLISYAMPFIRYRLGDLVTQGSPKCSCGAPFGTLRKVEGRAMDYLKLPGGQKLHPYVVLSPILYETDWVAKYQIVQHSLKSATMLIQPLREPSEAEVRKSETRVRKALAGALDFKIKIVGNIPPNPGGKHRILRFEPDNKPKSASQ